ncbi:hypothetical protein [Kitasatospora sp. NPDC085879]|jgi:hypothetical protein
MLVAYVIGHDETAKPYQWTYGGTPLKAARSTPLHELPRNRP